VPEPLKNHFGESVPRRIAEQIITVWPAFEAEDFVRDSLVGYGQLELMDRGRHIARALERHLPPHFPDAISILLQSVRESRPPFDGGSAMAPFVYLPHVSFVAQSGLEHFDQSMQALHLLTQRFTAEFSIRPFIERYPERALALLHTWVSDPSVHVRRLVSEGTRPRLPWAGRLREFQKNPDRVIELLERLKDDPELYVRRSVANNLNDIGRDNPSVLVAVASRWMENASTERRALVRHALRTLVKAGNRDALQILGFGGKASVQLASASVTPQRVGRGGKVVVEFSLRSTARRVQQLLVDLRVHYVKASGTTSAKVFKLRIVGLASGEVSTFRKSLSLRDMTTRQHYPGKHIVEAIVNGATIPIGAFTLTKSAAETGR